MIVELAHELLPYAAALYAFDGLIHVRQGERLLHSTWGRRFRWREAGWRLASPLPTLQVFLTEADRLPAEGDVAAVRARRAAQLRAAPRLLVSSALLFAVLFVALPAAVYRTDASSGDVGMVVSAAAILWTVVVALAAHAARRAGQTRREALGALAPALFFPPAAAHVLSFLWRDAYRAWSPLAVASVLLDPAEFRRLARSELRRLDEAARGTAGTALEVDARVRRDAVTRLLAGVGIDAAALAAEAAPEDALAAGFCPLCETEYRAGFSQCTDCGVGLRPFAASPGPSGSPAPR